MYRATQKTRDQPHQFVWRRGRQWGITDRQQIRFQFFCPFQMDAAQSPFPKQLIEPSRQEMNSLP